MKVGDFGIGAATPIVNDANTASFCGFIGGGGANGSNWADNYMPAITLNRGAQSSQIQVNTSGGLTSRSGNTNSGWTSWATCWTDRNTTKASDGTLKVASPVVQLFSDGTYQTNDESIGCTVTRLGVGQYLIEGCMGMNADTAWGGQDGGFEIPTDRNKQPLIWLDYEVSADGSVLVKTYHRAHPAAPCFARNELESVSDGDPIDIPVDQFVSVRVEMPAVLASDERFNQFPHS